MRGGRTELESDNLESFASKIYLDRNETPEICLVYKWNVCFYTFTLPPNVTMEWIELHLQEADKKRITLSLI